MVDMALPKTEAKHAQSFFQLFQRPLHHQVQLRLSQPMEAHSEYRVPAHPQVHLGGALSSHGCVLMLPQPKHRRC